MSLLEHDGIFEDPEPMKHKGQSSIYPLVLGISYTERDYQQNKENCQVIQHILPVQKVSGNDVFHPEKDKYCNMILVQATKDSCVCYS